MRPRLTHRFRVATVVPGAENESAGPPPRSAFDHPRTHDHNLSRRGGHLGAGTTRAAGLAPENGPLAPAPARPRDPRDHPNRRQPGRVVRDASLVTDACRPESSATGRTTVIA